MSAFQYSVHPPLGGGGQSAKRSTANSMMPLAKLYRANEDDFKTGKLQPGMHLPYNTAAAHVHNMPILWSVMSLSLSLPLSLSLSLSSGWGFQKIWFQCMLVNNRCRHLCANITDRHRPMHVWSVHMWYTMQTCPVGPQKARSSTNSALISE